MEEKVYFPTSDNLKLCGILTSPVIPTKKCIVLCHGITVNKEEGGIFTGLARKLSDAGFAVFRFDFRGHGESGGKSTNMTIRGEIKDIEAAFEFLKNKGFDRFAIVAASFGAGATSFYLAQNRDTVSALALWNPSIDYGSRINSETEWGKKYWGKPALDRAKKFGFTEIGRRKFKVGLKLIEEVHMFKPWKKLLNIPIPILFIHGDKDTFVPYEDSVKYSKMVKNGTLVIIKGAEHGFHDKKEDAEKADQATVDFLLKNLI